MRIALVTPYSWSVPGGVNSHVEHLAGQLIARGHEAWVIAPVGAITPSWRPIEGRRLQSAAERLIPAGTAVSLPSNGSRAHIALGSRVLPRLDRALALGGFDLVHVHDPLTPLVAAGAVLLATSPVVGTFHAALDSSAAYLLLTKLVQRLMTRIDVRIAVSEAARAYPMRLFPGDYRIVPNGVDTDEFARAVGRPRVVGRVCFIGRPEKRKGLEVLLQAFAELRRRRPHATLSVIGATAGQLREVMRANGSPGVGLGGIEARGWATDEEKVDQLAQAEVVCAPSLSSESFGIVLVEAMAAGVPVVASDLPGYRSVLQNGAAGRLVRPDDPMRLADALAGLLDDPEERSRLAVAGLTRAREFAWNRVTDQVLAAYDEALEVGRRPGAHRRSQGGAWSALRDLVSGRLPGAPAS
jgi:phosphatidyl-myo-inositol alpha-mannosyltransferase